MRRKSRLIVLLLLICLLIAACGNDPVLVVVDDPVAQPQCRTTGMESFHAEMVYPREGEIIDPNQQLTIQWELDCLPESMTLILAENINPPGSGGGTEQELIYLDDLPLDTREYTYTNSLNPAASYISGVIIRTWDNDSVLADYSGGWITGPICKANKLEAPTLRLPVNGGPPPYWKEVGNGQLGVDVEFSYPFENCTPDGYEVFISTEADFSTQNYFDGLNGNIPIYGIADDYEKIFRGTSSGLDNCTIYFWQAWATSEGATGPVSETFSFKTDFDGDCKWAIVYQATRDSNCRSNPWIRNNEVGIIREGDTALMLGRDEEGWWGKFQLDNGRECWVHMSSLVPYPVGIVFDHMIYTILPHDPEPEVSGDGGSQQPVTACMAPDAAGKPTCQSPCPDPSYAGRVCTP